MELWGENVSDRRGEEVVVGFEGEEGFKGKIGLEEGNRSGRISGVLGDEKMQHQKIEEVYYCIV